MNLPQTLTITLFDEFVMGYLNSKADQTVGLEELDRVLTILYSHALTLSLHFKQRYLLKQSYGSASEKVDYFTKQELANKYRVSIRTVSNWISDGLVAEEIGGIKRISCQAIRNFQTSRKGKKFNWRSIKR